MPFRNREHAAQQLLPYLEAYADSDSLILAVPQGGVPIAVYLGEHLRLRVEPFLVKKIGHPQHPELAIGAVTLEDHCISNSDVPLAYVNQQVSEIRAELRRRHQLFSGRRPTPDYKGRTLILVDDGIATGETLSTAISLLRTKQPKAIVVAVPVAPVEAIARFRMLADAFVFAYTPGKFEGVGQFYQDFSPVDDHTVRRLLGN